MSLAVAGRLRCIPGSPFTDIEAGTGDSEAKVDVEDACLPVEAVISND